MREKTLTQAILRSGDRDTSRGADYVRRAFETYRVNSYAVLVDHTSVPDDLPNIPDRHQVGVFTFDIDYVGSRFAGESVRLLSMDGPMPRCDGWLVASTSRAAAFALCKGLMRTGNDQQVVTRLYGGQVSEISGYVDVFSGETDTLVYVNHYFNRKYRITYPLDIRYTVRACDGTIRVAGQRIIPPGGLAVIDCREMELGAFAGYLWLEIEVESLQTRIQPFIHFWADYISEAGLCRNHQSGWDPWGAGTVFARGFMPVEPELELTCSFYNANETEARVSVLLHYNQRGEEKTVQRKLAAIPPGQMSFQNVSDQFEDVSFEGVKSAFYLLKCDQALHRPNYYVGIKGRRQYINTSHQTGSDARHWAIPTDLHQRDYLDRLEQLGVDPWVIQFPLLEERFEIESYLGLLSSTFCALSEFTFIFRDEAGRVVFENDERVDGASPQFLNLREYARAHGVDIGSGLFGLAPRRDLASVPKRAISVLGFRHRKYPYICTAPASGLEDPNLPFFIGTQRSIPLQQQWDHSPLLTTDRFAPGVVSDAFDSLIIVTNCSLLREYSRECEYRLDILDQEGRKHCLHRRIAPQGFDAFWLSEVLEQAGIATGSGYFTIWERSYDTVLISYHFLYRRGDHALSCDDTFEGTLLVQPQVWDRTTATDAGAEDAQVDKNVISGAMKR